MTADELQGTLVLPEAPASGGSPPQRAALTLPTLLFDAARLSSLAAACDSLSQVSSDTDARLDLLATRPPICAGQRLRNCVPGLPGRCVAAGSRWLSARGQAKEATSDFHASSTTPTTVPSPTPDQRGEAFSFPAPYLPP
jgi:hypothetical protein